MLVEDSSENQQLFYKVREASSTDTSVLVIVLHGYGANEDDLLSLATMMPANYTIVSPQAPFKIGSNSYQWYKSSRNEQGGFEGDKANLDSSLSLLKKLITEMQLKYKADASHTIIAGFSQGAIMSILTGLSFPELVSGVGAWSGALFDSVKKAKEQDKPSEVSYFIAHGDADNRIPYIEAVHTKEWLDKHLYQSVFHTYKNMGHSISKEEINDFVTFVQKTISHK